MRTRVYSGAPGENEGVVRLLLVRMRVYSGACSR